MNRTKVRSDCTVSKPMNKELRKNRDREEYLVKYDKNTPKKTNQNNQENQNHQVSNVSF